MPTTEDLKKELSEKTAVGVEEVEKRVFYTLMGTETKTATEARSNPVLHLACHRLAAFCGLLVKTLEEKGVLNHEEIDALLMDAVSPLSSDVIKGCICE